QGKVEQLAKFDKDKAEEAGGTFRQTLAAMPCHGPPRFNGRIYYEEQCGAEKSQLDKLDAALQAELHFKQILSRLAARPYILDLCELAYPLPHVAVWPVVNSNPVDIVYYYYAVDQIATFTNLYLYTLGSWLLPMLYGVLGATVFVLRSSISSAPS